MQRSEARAWLQCSSVSVETSISHLQSVMKGGYLVSISCYQSKCRSSKYTVIDTVRISVHGPDLTTCIIMVCASYSGVVSAGEIELLCTPKCKLAIVITSILCEALCTLQGVCIMHMSTGIT